VETVSGLLPRVLERVERGDPGEPQGTEGAGYFSFFEPEFAWIDWSRPAEEIYRQVRAWRFASVHSGDLGALTELEGERVRVLRVSLEGGAGRPVECGDGTVWILETEPA
jgi:methionyl-tRNA formyltransferase